MKNQTEQNEQKEIEFDFVNRYQMIKDAVERVQKDINTINRGIK